jgi:O-antigen/teichoic acid export membrane protein
VTGTHAARGAVVLTGAVAFRVVLGLGTAALLTRALGIDGYGKFLLMLSLVVFLGVVFTIAADRVVTADTAREIGQGNYGRAKAFLVEFATLMLAIGAAVGAAVLIFAPFAPGFFGDELTTHLDFAAFLVMVAAMRRIIFVTLTIHGRFTSIAVMRSAESVFRLGAVIVFVVLLDQGLRGALAAELVTEVLVVAVGAFPAARTVRYLRPHKRPERWVLPVTLRAHGKWAVAKSMAMTAVGQWRLWLVALVLDAEGAAVYGLTRRILSVAKGVFPMQIVLDALYARQVTNEAERTRLILQYAVKYKLLVAVGLIVVGNIIADPFIELMFPNLYPETVPVFRIMMFMLIAKTVGDVVNPYLNAIQAQRYGFAVFAIGLIAWAVIAPPLVLLLGVEGAAIEVAIAAVITAFATYRFAKRADPSLSIDWLGLVRYGRDDFEILKRVALRRRADQPVVRSADRS